MVEMKTTDPDRTKSCIPTIRRCRFVTVHARRCARGYLWVYIDPKKNVVFDYTPTRQRAGPLDFLGDLRWVRSSRCLRRLRCGLCPRQGDRSGLLGRIHGASSTRPRTRRRRWAHEALLLIRDLYRIERQAKDERLDGPGVCWICVRKHRPADPGDDRGTSSYLVPERFCPRARWPLRLAMPKGQWQALIPVRGEPAAGHRQQSSRANASDGGVGPQELAVCRQ